MKRPDASCPLCGEPNDCALARGETVAECWCVGECFPPELLAAAAAADRDRCVCRRCLARAGESRPASSGSRRARAAPRRTS